MTQSDVWTLTNADQDFASEDLNLIINQAMKFGGASARAYLRKLWDNESWASIKAKLQVESSAWVVWYMDGVNAHLRNLLKDKQFPIRVYFTYEELQILQVALHAIDPIRQLKTKAETAIHDLSSRIDSTIVDYDSQIKEER
jgi:hypothetical protein